MVDIYASGVQLYKYRRCGMTYIVKDNDTGHSDAKQYIEEIVKRAKDQFLVTVHCKLQLERQLGVKK